MEQLKFYDKNENINDMYLSELKNILYINKNLEKDYINKIKVLIEKKINNSLLSDESSYDISELSQLTESDKSISSKIKSNNNNSNEDTESYKNSIKNMYSKKDKKGENEKFTQTSKKLFDRMLSHAQIINKGYDNNYIKPFKDDNIIKLGSRKNIIKK